MARGGARPGAGRPRKPVAKSAAKSTEKAPATRSKEGADEARSSPGGKSPLDYMLDVMNDSAADDARRDRIAMAAAPYVHAKASDTAPGKKEQKQARAQEAASGRFAPRPRPRLVSSN